MVSAFHCECHGILRIDENWQRQYSYLLSDSTVFLKPGANSEGYWKNSHLVAQVKEVALPIFKVLHPEYDGIFIFQNHHAKAPDALRAKYESDERWSKPADNTRWVLF